MKSTLKRHLTEGNENLTLTTKIVRRTRGRQKRSFLVKIVATIVWKLKFLNFLLMVIVIEKRDNLGPAAGNTVLATIDQ